MGRLFRFIRESSSRRYFPRVHVPIPIGGVVNTVWPGIYPCYLIVSFHSKASSYTAAYTVILTLIRFFLDPCIAVGLPLALNSRCYKCRWCSKNFASIEYFARVPSEYLSRNFIQEMFVKFFFDFQFDIRGFGKRSSIEILFSAKSFSSFDNDIYSEIVCKFRDL